MALPQRPPPSVAAISPTPCSRQEARGKLLELSWPSNQGAIALALLPAMLSAIDEAAERWAVLGPSLSSAERAKLAGPPSAIAPSDTWLSFILGPLPNPIGDGCYNTASPPLGTRSRSHVCLSP